MQNLGAFLHAKTRFLLYHTPSYFVNWKFCTKNGGLNPKFFYWTKKIFCDIITLQNKKRGDDMKYTLENGKNVNIPDTDIKKLMTTLQITEEEAINTWLFDNDYEEDDTVDELTSKAKENRVTATIHEAKADSPKKPRKPRTVKEDPEKINIIAGIAKFLTEFDEISIENVEITNKTKIIEFNIGENHYKLDLIRQRKPKN